MLFATINRLPLGIFLWIVVGLAVGWVGPLLFRRPVRGPSVLGDMIAGLIGSMVGGVIIGLSMNGDDGFMLSNFVSIVGACVAVSAWRALAFPRTA